jgi:hypothetical protein
MSHSVRYEYAPRAGLGADGASDQRLQPRRTAAVAALVTAVPRGHQQSAIAGVSHGAGDPASQPAGKKVQQEKVRGIGVIS